MLSIGIVLGVLTVDNLALKISLLAICAVVFVVLVCIKKTKRFIYLPLAILVGAVSFFVAQNVYISKSINESHTTFSATVDSEIFVGDGKTSFDIASIYLNGKKLSGKASVYFPFEIVPDFNAGDIVEVEGSLVSDEFLPLDSYFASSFSKRNTKFCYATSIEKTAEQNPNVMLAAEIKLKKAFYQNTKEDTASICIALIYGDKSGINPSLYNDVKISGLAHILAVSGMHIGILAGAVAFLLRKLKMNKKAVAFTVISLLFVYALFCGFSSSVTRAFIMASIFLMANAFGKKKDSLSILSLTAIIILVFKPIALFEVGFLLSFTSVIGILLFYRSFNYAFRKTGKVVSPLIATNLSANIMTYPIVAKFFGVLPIFSILTNLIVLPFIAFLFVFVLGSAVFVLILPISSILVIFDYIFIPLKAVVFTAGSFAVASIDVKALGIMSIAYYVDAVVLSRFVFLSRYKKAIIVSCVTAVCLAATFVIELLP